MSNAADVKISKWAYATCFAGDLVLLGLAWFICRHGHSPLTGLENGLMVFCGLAGAVLAVTPFYMEYQASLKMVETGAVVSMVSQLDQLQAVSSHIQAATSQWQNVQESSARTAGMAGEIAGRMTSEIASFTKFMQEANDGEKGTLRLEIEKLRREQHEFIQIIVRMLDHTFALHQAAVRSGQPGLIENLANFQAANRDVARRIGLVAYNPSPNEPFDPKLHQAAESQSIPPSNARIVETIASGYTYQGILLRPALVALQGAASVPPSEKAAEKKPALPPAKPAENPVPKHVAQEAPRLENALPTSPSARVEKPAAPVANPPGPAAENLPKEQNLF